MFVIVHNNSVILGPMRWNRFRFENTIQEECEVSATLPDRNDALSSITISDEVHILPVEFQQEPPFNSKIEILHGPFWEFTPEKAIGHYEVVPMPIEAVKNQLKSQAAAERYARETKGVKIEIQGVEITVDTDRNSRNVFAQRLIITNENDTLAWKFPEAWMTLSKTELTSIVVAGAEHVQQQFDWEKEKVAEIEACTTLEKLDGVIIKNIEVPGVE